MAAMKYLILFCLTILSGCATRQDVTVLNDRLIGLEQEAKTVIKKQKQFESFFDTQDKTIDKKDQSLRGHYAQLKQQLGLLREELQSLSGRLEEVEFALNQGKALTNKVTDQYKNNISQYNKEITNNTDRIAILENYLNIEATAKKGDQKIELSDKNKVPKSAKDMYNVAKKRFDNGDTEGAFSLFRTFLKKYSKSSRADNAQFWIGEIYFKDKWYEKAILEYQKVIDKYPKGNKVPAAYLKQGMSFGFLKQKSNARLIYRELIKKFPKSSEAKVAKKKLGNL